MLDEKNLVTRLAGLSELESISMNDGVGARDEWRREDNFSLKDPAISGMGLVFDGLSLDKMMVRSESRSEAVRICSSHGKLFSARYSHGCSATKHREVYFTKINNYEYWFVDYAAWILRWRLHWRLPSEGPICRYAISKDKLVTQLFDLFEGTDTIAGIIRILHYSR